MNLITPFHYSFADDVSEAKFLACCFYGNKSITREKFLGLLKAINSGTVFKRKNICDHPFKKYKENDTSTFSIMKEESENLYDIYLCSIVDAMEIAFGSKKRAQEALRCAYLVEFSERSYQTLIAAHYKNFPITPVDALEHTVGDWGEIESSDDEYERHESMKEEHFRLKEFIKNEFSLTR